MIFGLAAGFGKGVVHALAQSGAEERVVLVVDPQHRHAGGPAELAVFPGGLTARYLLLGCPSPRPPRPAAKVMIAFTCGGFRLESAIEAQPPADLPTTMTSFGTMRFSAAM